MNNLQQPIITDQQRKALEVCFQKIKADYVQLAPYAIMARIINIEGKTAHDALKGYQLMRAIGVIPDSFVKGGVEIEKAIIKTYFHPVMCDLITRFGLEIEKFNLVYKPVKPGGKSLAIETATAEECDTFTKEYREVNRMSIGDEKNTATASENRSAVRAFGLSLEDDEKLEYMLDTHAAIDKELGLTPNPTNRETKKIILQQAMKEQNTQELTRRITNTLLNLDNDF